MQPPVLEADAALVADELLREASALDDRSLASLRALRSRYSARLRSVPPSFMVAVADRLLASGTTFGHRFFAYELISRHGAALASLREVELVRLGRGIDSWDAVDTFACYLSGPAWRMGHVSDATIAGWARSEDRWWRRAALVSSTSLNVRGTPGDPARTLALADLLIADRDDMVVKAMSWALRALAVRDPAAVRRYLDEHATQLAPRVKREVRSKLDTGLKTPRRRG